MGPKKGKIKEESKKKSIKPKNCRCWTDVELDAYADALADPKNSFAATLDKLALKKSCNNEVFEHMQKELAAETETEDFQSRNNDYFKRTPTKLDISMQRRWWCLDHFLLPWNELLLQTNFHGRKPVLFFFVAMSKKRNYPCFSLMQPHTIFNMKMQCNVFLPHVLLTLRQFQRLEYSVCPSVYTDDLIFTRKNRLIIATCCLYCQTNHLRWTNRLRRLVHLSINTANTS